MTTTVGVSALGVRPLAGTWARAKPSAIVTSPVGTVSTFTAAWTYTSPVSRPQYSYRIQVRSADGSAVLYDTFTVISSSSSSIPVSYLFSGGSTYQIWVAVADLFDTSDWATTTFTVDLVDVNDFPVNNLVGSIYEVGINGIGLMLDDNPQRSVRRKLQVLQAPRFATGETPFSEAVERYTFDGQSSFIGGAGQVYAERTTSDPTRYRDSYGVNPFEDEVLQAIPTVAVDTSDNYATPWMVVVNGRYYVITANGELTSKDIGGSGGAFTITGAAAPTDLTTDGKYWYYADGANIFRNSTNADPVTAWSTLNALKVRPCLDRIACTYIDGSSNIVVSTLDNAAAEEVVGGRFKYPSSTFDIPDLAAGDGFLWFIVNKLDHSQIHFWKVGTADTYAAVGLTLPEGQKATALGYYLGNLFIRAVENNNHKVTIYRCVPNDGVLTPEKVLDFSDGSNDLSVGSFSPYGRFMLFTWRNMEAGNTSGVGAVDLSTGGWAKWIGISSSNNTVRSIAVLENKILFSVDTQGAYKQGSSMGIGWLTTSIHDQASGLTKVFDEVRAVFDPLPASCDVTIEYTLDGGVSYTALTADAHLAGQQLLNEALGLEGRSIGLRITLDGNSTDTPKLHHVQIKLHALSLSDHLMQLPVKCADEMTGLNGQLLPTNAPGGGLKLIRTLESLIGSRVKYQDLDWPINQTPTVWELVDVDTELTSVFNKKQNRNVTSGVATLTLRRSA